MNRFLIVRLGSLGDVVHGIPVAAALRQEFPNARVDWMVDPRYIELLNLVKGIDRRIGVDPRAIRHGAGRRRFRETLRELREGWRFIGSSRVVRAVMVGLATGLFGVEWTTEPPARPTYHHPGWYLSIFELAGVATGPANRNAPSR